ncbi:MAG: hypothetical protein GY847_10030, partial [Proteobacteria bacterium]|nr:hypothetical protein [Pseudomonadota bacterium]
MISKFFYRSWSICTISEMVLILYVNTLWAMPEDDNQTAVVENGHASTTADENTDIAVPESEYDKRAIDSIAKEDCFPRCRTGYICQKKQCISRCNPECPVGKICTKSGECISKSIQTNTPEVELREKTQTEEDSNDNEETSATT